MPNLLRSRSNLQHTSSDSDVSKIASIFSTPIFVSQRKKRCRQSSDDDGLPVVRRLRIFEEWQKNQGHKAIETCGRSYTDKGQEQRYLTL
ncbi:unnamed protein product [Pieris brassicae]|uniref:Uncharacterized protein n=1 Tax=Pieris brassicae TaxID=7116 RepID=A0A9P0T9D3_PIEBR|nr:unnamed protein product [Pieris brassicae]